VYAGAAGSYSHSSSSYQLPRQLLTPAAAEADVGLRDVYEYLTTQVCCLGCVWVMQGQVGLLLKIIPLNC
jgi:hypothetical protein